MQYNEVGYTYWQNGSADGEGFDIDTGCKNTLIQFNYVHHNQGGGVLICNIKECEHTNSIVRNNIFYKNGAAKGTFIVATSNVDDVQGYNNLVVFENSGNKIIGSDDWFKGGRGTNFNISNNIFMASNPGTTEALFGDDNIDNFNVDFNIYHNLAINASHDKNGVAIDPQITIPGYMEGWDYVVENCVPKNVAVFNGAKEIENEAKIDIRGYGVENRYYFGPYAYK
jgi:hypothetical protein